MSPVTRIRPRGPGEVRTNLQREYVSGGTSAWYGRQRLALPWFFDDVTAEFGFEVYARMKLDSQVSACLTFFRAAIIEDGLTITAAVTDDKADGYEKAQEIADKARAMFDAMDNSLDEVIWDMLNCLAFGNKVGELIYTVEDNMLNLKKIKVKPGRSVAFVTDQYLNIIGLIADTTGIGIISGMPDPKDILPKEKFMIMTFRPEDSDPRGTSILRAAYDPWWRKRQILPDYLKFLSQFAGPSIIGYTSEGAELENGAYEDSDGNLIATPQEAMTQALMEYRNGSAAAFPYGAKVDINKSEGEGGAFLTAIGQCNLEITKAILTQQLATEEGQFMARAAATVHLDVLNTLIRQGKRSVARVIGVDVLRRWVNYNYGASALPLTPRATLGSIEYKDMSAVMQAIAALQRANYFVDEQLPAVDKILGLPTRTAEQMAKQRQAAIDLVKAKAPATRPAPTPTSKPLPKDGSQPPVKEPAK